MMRLPPAEIIHLEAEEITGDRRRMALFPIALTLGAPVWALIWWLA